MIRVSRNGRTNAIPVGEVGASRAANFATGLTWFAPAVGADEPVVGQLQVRELIELFVLVGRVDERAEERPVGLEGHGERRPAYSEFADGVFMRGTALRD
jgi:hypothetical protein